MPTPGKTAGLPTRKALENYANAYMGAFLNAVEKEKPEHVPALARNSPYDIEICLMPNQCFVMLFERADRQSVAVRECDWKDVEKRVMSEVAHMVVVYAHEGPTVADAISRGKKDAVRSIRALEDSNLSKAVAQLEKILDELTHVEKGNKSLLKLAELEMSKLKPIRDVISNAGPEVDMLAMVDALRNYPSHSVEVSVDVREKDLLEKVVGELGDLSDVIRRVESQDEALEKLEKSMEKTLSEFQRMIDEKMSQGLAVLLSSSDRKIDKGLEAIKSSSGKDDHRKGTRPTSALEERVKLLEAHLQGSESKRIDVSKEIVLAVAEVRDSIDRLGARVSRLEQSVQPQASHAPPHPVRRLAKKASE